MQPTTALIALPRNHGQHGQIEMRHEPLKEVHAAWMTFFPETRRVTGSWFPTHAAESAAWMGTRQWCGN
jgi:hypothetical protein